MPHYGPQSSGPSPRRAAQRKRQAPVSPPKGEPRAHGGGGGLAPVKPVRAAPVAPAPPPSPARGQRAGQPRGTLPKSSKRQYIEGALTNPSPDLHQEHRILGSELARELRQARIRLRMYAYVMSHQPQAVPTGPIKQEPVSQSDVLARQAEQISTNIGKIAPHTGLPKPGILSSTEKLPVVGDVLNLADPFTQVKALEQAPGNVTHNVETLIHPPSVRHMTKAQAEAALKRGELHPSLGIAPWIGKGAAKGITDPPTAIKALHKAADEAQEKAGPNPKGQRLGDVADAQELRSFARMIERDPANLPKVMKSWAGHHVLRHAEVPPEVSSVSTEVTPGQKILGSLRDARIARAKQKKGYSIERGKRFGEAGKAYYREGGGMAGRKAMGPELAGELPKQEFTKLENLTADDVDVLAREVMEHNKLQLGQKIRTMDAIEKAVNEKRVPTTAEMRDLKVVFGPAADEFKHIRFHHKVAHVAAGIINLPRSFMASADISFPMRQGLILGTRHPVIWAKNFRPMIRAFHDKEFFNASQEAIFSDPDFHYAEIGGLGITEPGGGPGIRGAAEPYVYADVAEAIPVAGHIVKASERAYNQFGNQFRFQVFKYGLDMARKNGRNIEDPQFLKALSTFINAASGRGELNLLGLNIEKAAPVLNAMMFSPRLAASRLNFIDPVWYLRLAAKDPAVAREAVRTLIQFTGFVAGVLGLATYAGFKVVDDPRNADFAKIKIGDTRIDIMGGLQQDVRLMAQLITKTVISSSTGRKLTLGPGYGQLNRRDILIRWFSGKAAPVPGVINDFFVGTMYDKTPFSIKKELYQHLVPLVAQDVYDLWNNKQNLPATVAGAAAGSVGVGIQTYGKPQKALKAYKKKAQQAGMPPPSAQVMKEKKIYDDLNYETRDKPPHEKALKLAALLDKKYGGKQGTIAVEHMTTEAQAQDFYDTYKSRLYGNFAVYDHALRDRLKRKQGAQRIPSG